MSRKGNWYASTAMAAVLVCSGSVAVMVPAEAQETQSLETIVVLGVRGSEQKAVEMKRDAMSIQDSIAAEDIGRLPDTTISDSLQRITGVQIDRSGGEGTSVNIRGLPQVGTLLNGEAFLTTASIVDVQPDFGDIPSQLFHGADVIKSPTANLLNAGITGTINLKTWRPYDLNAGWTLSAAVEGHHGTISKLYEPSGNFLVGYNAGKWGVLVSAAYSDVTLENSTDGMDQYPGEIMGETTDSTTLSEGFLNAYGGAPLPSGLTLLHPSECVSSGGIYSALTPNGCDVDVNGDGKANGAFYGVENFGGLQRLLENQRLGFNTSLQADLGQGFDIAAEFFFTDEKSYNRIAGYQLNAATWIGATFLPIKARNTGVQVYNGWNGGGTPLNDFYATQVYEDYLGDIETYSENDAIHSTSRNYNFELNYDGGGNFTGNVRALYGSAHRLYQMSYVQFGISDGSLWPNEPVDAAPVGVYVYPGSNRVFDPYGFAPNIYPATVDMTGDHLAVTFPQNIRDALTNESAYSLKTITSENNYERNASMLVLRADGHYRFSESGISFDFGIRRSNRIAENTNFELVAPVYGGNGAYNNTIDPVTGLETNVRVPNDTGCYVRYKAVDVLLDGGGIAGACKAGDPVTGFYRAGTISALNPSQLPDLLGKNVRRYSNFAGVEGVGVYALDPKVMDNVLAFQNALYPGEIRHIDPGATWKVDIKQTTGYVQANFGGTVVLPFSANVGAKFIRTDLAIDQHKVGNAGVYYLSADDLGVTHTSRSFTDVLPSANLAVDVRDDLKVRLAYSKNMQLLNLDQWGGALTLSYAIVAGSSPPISAVLGGTQNGNPNLNPWRSTNYDASVEYYYGESSMVSIAAFYIDVASFIGTGSVLRCDLPDQDGVVRDRCVAISGPVQGAGKALRGIEVGVKQSFDFLPGFWSNFGLDVNFTYSPSNVGKDVAGHTIPFQNNSAQQANLVLWYQDDQFQVRLAGNYRSKRAVEQDYAGISQFERYQLSTFYLDASASYDITKNWQVYVQGSNITGESEHYYLVWPDQKLNTTQFEPRYTVGVRAHF